MIGALLSETPRPYMRPSRISGANGGRLPLVRVGGLHVVVPVHEYGRRVVARRSQPCQDDGVAGGGIRGHPLEPGGPHCCCSHSTQRASAGRRPPTS